MRVGLLGGSFDPVHKGHIELGAAALRQLKLDRVYYVLSPKSPFKTTCALTSIQERLRLLRKALSNSRFKIGLWEVARGGVSYMVDTVRAYKRRHPKDDLFLIVGSDILPGFKKWRNPRQLLQLSRLVVGLRPGYKRYRPQRLLGAEIIYLKGRFPDLSSTQMRAESGHSPQRARHSRAVAVLAAQLGRRHGWNPQEAYQAGLYHDWAKEWSPQELKAYVKKHRVSVPSLKFIKKHSPHVLHAYVGAAVVKRNGLIENPKALQAIASHTLGNPQMTLEDKILYVADLCSHDRTFKEATLIRALALKDIQAGFKAALALKIAFNLRHSRPLHPMTLTVWNNNT